MTGAQGHGRTGAQMARRAALVRAHPCARALAVALAACGVAHGAAAQGVMSARVTEARWDARLSVQPVALRVPGSARNAAPTSGSDSSGGASRRGVSEVEIALGIAGSAAGMWGGAFAGLLVYDAQSGCNPDCDDAGLGAGVIGLVAGSIVGTAVGTRLGAKLAHRRVGGFGRRLVAGGAGLLAGLAAFELASNLTGHDYNAPPLIAFPVAQGFVGALLGRAR